MTSLNHHDPYMDDAQQYGDDSDSGRAHNTRGASGGRSGGASGGRSGGRRARRTHALEQAMQVDRQSEETRRQAVCVLEVLAGISTPEQAAATLTISLQTYYNLESRALRGLVRGCAPDPRGRSVEVQKELELSRQRCEDLERQLQRHQALLRSAQRVAGVVVEEKAAGGRGGKAAAVSAPAQRGSRKPRVRALRAISALGGSQGVMRGPMGPVPSPVREDLAAGSDGSIGSE